jgi:hypothetical protein
MTPHRSYVFSAGHHIRVAVSSSNYPRFEVNPNTGASLVPNRDNKGPFMVATNTLHVSADHPSSITLPIVPYSDLPVHPIVEQFDQMSPEMQRLGLRLFDQRGAKTTKL